MKSKNQILNFVNGFLFYRLLSFFIPVSFDFLIPFVIICIAVGFFLSSKLLDEIGDRWFKYIPTVVFLVIVIVIGSRVLAVQQW